MPRYSWMLEVWCPAGLCEDAKLEDKERRDILQAAGLENDSVAILRVMKIQYLQELRAAPKRPVSVVYGSDMTGQLNRHSVSVKVRVEGKPWKWTSRAFKIVLGNSIC